MRTAPGTGTAARRVARRGFAACCGILMLVGTAACSGTSAQRNQAFGDAAFTYLEPPDRPTPGTVAGPTLDGARADLAQFRGHVTVLNVWGSWCATCRVEAPELQAVHGPLTARGVRFLGIDVREEGGPEAARAFTRRFGLTYPNIDDPAQSTLLALRGAVPPTNIPTTLVLDADGRIAARISGPVTRRTLTDLVDQVARGAAA